MMTSLTGRIFVNSASILNGLYKSQSFTKCIRQMHLLTNQPPMVISRVATLTSIQNPCSALSPIVYNPVRFKKNKRSSNRDEEEKDEDSDAEDGDGDLSEFKEGDKSDRHLAQVKVQTLRLDTVVKAGLGLPKRKIEKLFYESKIRINGKKVAKKSMDILKECEIDVIKGPSPENPDFLLVSRIEILQVKAEGLNFVLTIRRNKNLTIENYE
ncbi:uncharacterized protein LOC129579147 [Sitodiplosis mosellana]|uniref:uncharacterized protein LOC129579147 n=1 Tax=Sitodiplosis mosellana TaxID=263140 RepID=UPI002444A83C|nr:uncharacterized protein LOC129579147 [Sitodiplosis mosellana]